MLHWYPVKELMHKLTGLNVEKGAVFELTNHFEEQMEKVIVQSKKELEKLNNLKEIQGLYQKNRIDRDCIRNAIKIIKPQGTILSLLKPQYEVKYRGKGLLARQEVNRIIENTGRWLKSKFRNVCYEISPYRGSAGNLEAWFCLTLPFSGDDK